MCVFHCKRATIDWIANECHGLIKDVAPGLPYLTGYEEELTDEKTQPSCWVTPLKLKSQAMLYVGRQQILRFTKLMSGNDIR